LADFPEVLTDILREYELSPSDLILEITETAYVRDVDRLIRTAEALRALGCQFAQGYCFSMPVPPEKFERFLTEGVAL